MAQCLQSRLEVHWASDVQGLYAPMQHLGELPGRRGADKILLILFNKTHGFSDVRRRGNAILKYDKIGTNNGVISA